jgi:hypothetical protein
MTHFTSLGSLLRKARFVLTGTLVVGLGAGFFASTASAEQTTSQATSNQLNQLFEAETTPNKSAQGEGYASGEFAYLSFKHEQYQIRFQLQGQYSFTDQLAVGGLVPLIQADFNGPGSNFGFGDITFYAQYKLDQIINHDIVDVTAQCDLVLPTGDGEKGQDRGKFGIRPWLLAYKDFGQVGPGNIGAYGSMGVTIAGHPDFRFDLAGTYEFERIVGVLEFYDQCGDGEGAPLVNIIPGAVYRGIGPLEIALGFPFGLNDASPDWGVVLKATWAFQK